MEKRRKLSFVTEKEIKYNNNLLRIHESFVSILVATRKRKNQSKRFIVIIFVK